MWSLVRATSKDAEPTKTFWIAINSTPQISKKKKNTSVNTLLSDPSALSNENNFPNPHFMMPRPPVLPVLESLPQIKIVLLVTLMTNVEISSTSFVCDFKNTYRFSPRIVRNSVTNARVHSNQKIIHDVLFICVRDHILRYAWKQIK